MTEVELATAFKMCAGAVALAVMSPKAWHDIVLDATRKRWGVGPGGSATEEEDDSA